MTVIVFRDHILAADSECHVDDVRSGTIDKIRRIEGGRVAMTGYLPVCVALLDWVLAGRNGKPPSHPTEVGRLYLIPDRGPVTMIEESLEHRLARAPFYAWGIGSEIAIGAMARGATAEEAVRAAIKYHTKCGGRVKVLGP